MTDVGRWVAGILAAVITAVLSAVLISRLTAPDEARTPTAPPPSTSAAGPPGAPGPASRQRSSSPGLRPGRTQVRVSGQGFDPGEDVVVRFHTETVAHTAADDQGGFADVSVKVPTDWTFTGQFEFVATGASSITSADREFRVT